MVKVKGWKSRLRLYSELRLRLKSNEKVKVKGFREGKGF
jgi:hypothetical protein